MADIAQMIPVDRTIEIKKPRDGSLLGVRIQLGSLDDKEVEKVRKSITERNLYLQARGKTFKAEEIEQNRYNLLWAAVKGWEWYNPTGVEGDESYDPDEMPTFEGEVPTFNQKNFIAIVSKVGMKWFGDQINEELGDDKAFFN